MKVYCPYCRKEVKYKIEKRDIVKFKNVIINSYENVGICIECNQDLYINELENANLDRIYKAYKQNANIISAEEIVNFRKKYDISQRELTSILEFGKMTINRYEKGDVPTKSQSDYIRLLIDNEEEFKNKVEIAFKKGNITEKTYNKILSSNKKYIDDATFENKMQSILRRYLNEVLKRDPDIYNGYKSLDLEKLENLISYLASKVKNLTVTSMNKYLWYIDMLSFNQRTVSITGLTYQNQKFGPTIIDQKYNELTALNGKYKREDAENESGITSKIISNKNFDLKCFSDKELEIINYVIKQLKDKKVVDISEMSHKEDGWKKTKRLEVISFEYAMNLKTI